MGLVRPLDWGDVEQIAALDPPYDLLLGADIMYGGFENVGLLAQTILALSRPGTSVLLATPDWPSRTNKNDMTWRWKWEEKFEDVLVAHGFEIRDISEEPSTAAIIAGVGRDRQPLRVIELHRGVVEATPARP